MEYILLLFSSRGDYFAEETMNIVQSGAVYVLRYPDFYIESALTIPSWLLVGAFALRGLM